MDCRILGASAIDIPKSALLEKRDSLSFAVAFVSGGAGRVAKGTKGEKGKIPKKRLE